MSRLTSPAEWARRGAVVAIVLATALLGSACTDEGEKEDGVPTARLCGSSLNEEARQALGRVSRDDTFREGRTFSLEEARSNLRTHDEIITSRSKVCAVHSPNSSEQDPLFEIEFARTSDSSSFPEKGPGDIDYRLGERARADDAGATLSFRCPAGIPKAPPPPRITGALYLEHTDAHTDLPGEERAEAAMTILHSVALKMAETMGCGKDAKLPERVPAPVP